LTNTRGLAVYIRKSLVIDVITTLIVMPLLVKWLNPRYMLQG